MRADVFLTSGGYTGSRQKARELIEGGFVRIDGATVTKPAAQISEGEHTVDVRDPSRYVGRGGYKLEAALDAFGIDLSGKRALDIGASTGGFTDCMLQRGASFVTAVDAGAGQLAVKLQNDPRVHSIEHLNARNLTSADVGGRVEFIAMDVSFISATYILPGFSDLLCENGEAVVLIKPQFEVGRAKLGKGGIVKDPSAHREAVARVADCARGCGLIPAGLIASPIEGGDGNREFLITLSRTGEDKLTDAEIRRVTG